jgi:integrase
MNNTTSKRLVPLRRERYQAGSLTKEKRSNSPAVWVFRWREAKPGGGTVQRKKIIGDQAEFRTETAARKAVDSLRIDINAETVSTTQMTVRELAEHYKEKELGDDCGKTARTCETYRQHIDDHILPQWGDERVGDVKAFRVEAWLKSLDKADGTKSKMKAVFSVIYQHAMRFGWAQRNPIREVRQSAKRQTEPDVLTPEEVSKLLAVLPDYARTMAVVAAVTGLRRGELIGLRWNDIDFANGMIHVRRSLVDQIAGEPKTEASKRPVPLEPALAYALQTWREKTDYAEPGDWLFASPFDLGKNPYWPSTVLQKVIQPAARDLGIVKRIGWHTFRRTVATWLMANRETVTTAQNLLRHASPTMTLKLYAQAIDDDKRLAQGKITALLGLPVPSETEAVAA